MPPSQPSRSASRQPASTSVTSRKTAAGATAAAPTASASNGTGWVTGLAVGAVLLVGALMVGGWWMQAQRNDARALRQQADVYERYLQSTQEQALPSTHAERAAERAQAQATRQYLVNHPAVTPGAAFDKPGVQATGLAIVRAMDSAKGL